MSQNPLPKLRLVTRADFDGLVCAALFKELDLIDDILFVHPKDMADNRVPITGRDITTNLPYNERCYLAFDHHSSEALRHTGERPDNLVLDPEADSAARVVYRYYGGREAFPNMSGEMMTAVDKADAARFTKDEILDPSGWVLLNFIMDPRTGLGRFRDFAIPNFELMMRLIDYCREHTVDEILLLPDVQERVKLFFEHAEPSKEQIRRCTTMHHNVAVLDLRNERTIYACNRFMIYALFPKSTISIHAIWGRGAQNTVFAIGKSIFDRSCPINVGELCLRYGGGGHAEAGTVQTENGVADRVLDELIAQLKTDDTETVELDGGDGAVVIDDDLSEAESLLRETLEGNGMTLLPSKQDIQDLHERLDRIERMLAEMVGTPVSH